MQETGVWSLDQEDPLEKETATHFSIPAWEIPWTEEPGRHGGHKRVWHNLATKQQPPFLLNTYFVPETVLRSTHIFLFVTYNILMKSVLYSPHFTNEKIECHTGLKSYK